MAKVEYVRFSPSEKSFGETHLLHSQLELLHLMKSFHRFRVLRDEELVLKVTLKNYVEETIKDIIKLEKLLPKAQYKEPREEENRKESKNQERHLSLEDEIAKVRAKLSVLQGEI
jgi:hypothetical protein